MNSPQPSQPTCRVLKIASRGLIFDATEVAANEAISYTTSLLPLDSGTILAGWQCGPGKHTPTNTIRLARSHNNAQTWQQLPCRFDTRWQETPGSFLAAEMVEVTPGRVLLFTTWIDRSDPDRPLFNPITEGILPTRILYCQSTDEGDSWSDWLEIPTPKLAGCAVTGPILRWSDGTIACAFESFKEFDDPEPVDPAAWLTISRDGGETFERPWRVAHDPQKAQYYWDQRLCPTATPGEFFGLFWTHHRAEKRDANVHLLRASTTTGRQAVEQPVETPLRGQIATCQVALDGRLLAFVVDRSRPGTLTLWQSPDGGRNWPVEARLVVHNHDEQAAISQGRENIDFAKYWEDMGKWSFGHPAIRRLETGWLLAWYAGTPDRMSIHWARIVEESDAATGT